MGKVWKPQPIDVYQDWINTIVMEASDKLSPWETDFIENIGGKLAHGQELTQSQAAKLESIYSEKT